MLLPTHMHRVPILITLLISLSMPVKALEIRINDSRENNFYMDALSWVLDKSGVDYQLIHTKHPISTQKRKVALLINGEIDVIYAGTTQQMESSLEPIRFPITRGLIGSRLLIINKQYQTMFDQIHSLAGLKSQVAALGYGWPETEIFAASKMKYIEKPYDDIFQVIDKGGKYYFPRGILEAYSELTSKQAELSKLTIENKLLLKYKSAVFFFVNPKNIALKAAIEQGFNKGYIDGSYQKFFYNHPVIKKAFSQALLEQRTVLELPNPSFPQESHSIPARYWH